MPDPSLTPHTAALAGSYQCAYADFTLSGTVTAGDYVGLAFLTEAYTYQMLGGDTLASAAGSIKDSVNSFSALLRATFLHNRSRSARDCRNG